ncbi:hypothetical protein [Spirosoma pomorum]
MSAPNEDAQKALDAGGWRHDPNDRDGVYWRSTDDGRHEKVVVDDKYSQCYGASSTDWNDTSKTGTI